MDWFLYDNGLSHDKVKKICWNDYEVNLMVLENKIISTIKIIYQINTN